MSLSHSPSVVTDGLVLYYDMNNTQKSWKGAPATNLLTYSSEFDNAAWFKGLSSVTANTTIAPDGTLTADTLSFSASANANLQPTSAPTVTIGQQYTYSVYVRASTAVNNVNISMNGSDVAIAVTTEWQRVSRTVTAAGSTLGSTLVTRNAVATDIYIWGAQLETGSYATPYIPTTTTSASRSNTQAIVDLTNNNTITASSLTYAANNTFSFNGTNNYIDAGNLSSIQLPTAITMEAWINPNSTTGLGNIMAKNSNSGYRFRIQSGVLWWYVSGSSAIGGSVPNSSWSHCVVTGDSTGLKAYVNTVLVASNTAAFAPADATTGSLYIGTVSPSSEIFDGKIGVAKIYNRALSATEVSQNFNALRGRYGL